jgi:hypothetical protein
MNGDGRGVGHGNGHVVGNDFAIELNEWTG